MNPPVTIAVVGCGAWGRNYVRILEALPRVELRWLCDLSGGSLHQAHGMARGARVTGDLERVLADPRLQAVVIATDPEHHASHTLAALAAGKHVLVEKPMATSVAEAWAMVSAARKAERVLMVGHLMVYHPATAALRGLVRSGALGPLQFIYALRVNPPGREERVGRLWSLGPHDLSMIGELLGRRPWRLQARPDARGQVGRLTLDFGDQLTALVQLSLAAPRRERLLVVAGRERVAVFDDTRRAGKLVLYETRHHPSWSWGADLGRSLDQDLELPDPRGIIRGLIHESKGQAQPLADEEPLELQCQHFLSCAAQARRPRTSGQEGLEVVRLLAAAECSFGAGGVEVDPAVLDGELDVIQAPPRPAREEMR